MVGFNFAPRGWAFCDGQLLPINQNQALFSLLGTTYGGDGRVTFALPDLRGRTPLHESDELRLGSRAGEESHVLTDDEMPSHTHAMHGTASAGTTPAPGPTVLIGQGVAPLFHAEQDPAPMGPAAISTAGDAQGHNNMQPYLTVNFCIAITGLFPSRN